jgi:hypothetical protein
MSLEIFPAPQYLSNIPEKNIPNLKSERLVYMALSNLKEGFVKWSCNYLHVNDYDELHEGECDFIVALPKKGLLFIEVKGGEIKYDPQKELWTSKDRFGEVHKIKNPFQQADRSRRNIIEKLERDSSWPKDNFGNVEKVNIGIAVCFPNISRSNINLGPNWPADIQLYEEDLSQVGKSLENIFNYWSKRNRSSYQLGPPIIKVCKDVLCKEFELKIPAKKKLKNFEKEVVSLTTSQISILKGLRSAKKLAVFGGAGTGKTILAIEKARMLSAEGIKTVLICKNKTLSYFIRNSTRDETIDFEIIHSAKLVSRLARKYGKALRKRNQDETMRDYFDEYYPEILMEISEEPLFENFDALVVDEGQDFSDIWWTALNNIIKEDGHLYVFYDGNQSIFNSHGTFVNELTRYDLSENFRNSKNIYDQFSNLYKGDDGTEFVSKGPEGPEVRINSYNSQKDKQDDIVFQVKRQIKDYGLSPGDIGILNLSNEGATGLRELIEVKVQYRVGPADDRNVWDSDSIILMDSVNRIKGLEKPIIFMTNLSNLLSSDLTDEQKKQELYVAMSRAKYELHIFGLKEEINTLSKLIS